MPSTRESTQCAHIGRGCPACAQHLKAGAVGNWARPAEACPTRAELRDISCLRLALTRLPPVFLSAMSTAPRSTPGERIHAGDAVGRGTGRCQCVSAVERGRGLKRDLERMPLAQPAAGKTGAWPVCTDTTGGSVMCSAAENRGDKMGAEGCAAPLGCLLPLARRSSGARDRAGRPSPTTSAVQAQ